MTRKPAKMGRPRGFDEAAALDAAMRVFWEKGYEGTTLSDLTLAMGINRSSMYAAFGGKETLFRRVMERYRDGPMAYVREALAKPALREVVHALLDGAVKFLSQHDHPRGCLVLQGALACGDEASAVREALVAWRRSGQEALHQRMRQAQREGDLPADIDPADYARYLSTILNGLGIHAANGATSREMKRVAETALRMMNLEGRR